MRWFIAAILLVAIFGRPGSALAQECEGDPIEGFVCFDPDRSDLSTGSVFSASEGLAPRRALREEEDELEVRAGDGRFGVFVNGSAAFRDIDQERELGSDGDIYGAVVGVDYTSNAFVAALSLDYFNEDINFDDNAGKNEADEFGIQLLGIGYPVGNLYVIGATRVAYNEYDTERNITGNLGSTTAEGDPEGYKFLATGGVGYDFVLPQGFGLGVVASLEYERTYVDSYEEEGAEQVQDNTLAPNLSFDSDDRNTLTSVLELNATKAFSVPWGVLIPEAVFRYLHEFMDDPRTIEATSIELQDVAGAETAVQFRTNRPDRNYFNVGGAITSVFPQGWALFVDYHAVVGHSFREEHVVNFGVRTDLATLRNLF
jgi:uncharacterized protein YhjY with autotransporter beta-barrel domain